MKNVRHGDLALIGIEKLPEGLKKGTSKVLMTGSGGNDHSFDKGEFYPKQNGQFVIGYFVSVKGTNLYHIEHGKKVKGKDLRGVLLPVGIWELRKQNEETNSGMKPVQD